MIVFLSCLVSFFNTAQLEHSRRSIGTVPRTSSGSSGTSSELSVAVTVETAAVSTVVVSSRGRFRPSGEESSSPRRFRCSGCGCGRAVSSTSPPLLGPAVAYFSDSASFIV